MFQALAYVIYSFSGYLGLIVFRSALYLATFALVSRFLLKQHQQDSSCPWIICMGFLYGLVLLPRYASLRPGLLTYLLIITFLYVLECQPPRRHWLPLLGVLWSNLHGVSYPIMWWICGAYLGEALLDRFKTERRSRAPDRQQLPILMLVTIGSAMFTPHVWRLLKVPFLSLEYVFQTVAELRPIPLESLFSFQFSHLVPSHWTLIALLLLASCAAMLMGLLTQRLRMSHAILWAGGMALVMTSGRFVSECILLSLPVVAAHPVNIPQGLLRAVPRTAWVIVASALVIVPIRFVDALHHSFGDPAGYPLSSQNSRKAW